ncbi:hypothetical protein VNO80_25249 [Phaseolus coccineus]|uniref:Nrap protein domain-containing protein n=1 Tax=Phaseolus coccineus TaxID=3886 RepID=A0AAN9QNT3_PHACN
MSATWTVKMFPENRFSSVFPPEPHLLANEKIESLRLSKFVPSCVQALEVMIQLEGSGNWPMDEIAIEKTTSRFLFEIGLRFLRLLSHYDWTFSSLVVNINNDLIQRQLFAKKKKSGREWIKCRASNVLQFRIKNRRLGLDYRGMKLKRLVAYARSRANLLTKLTFQEEIGPYRWESLFRTPLNNYDAVIILHKDNLPYPQRLLFPSEVNHGIHVAEGRASKCFQPFLLPKDLKGRPEELKNKFLVDFDPSKCFIRDLKKRKHEEVVDEEYNPWKVLKAVGENGKVFVRSVDFLKPQGS